MLRRTIASWGLALALAFAPVIADAQFLLGVGGGASAIVYDTSLGAIINRDTWIGLTTALSGSDTKAMTVDVIINATESTSAGTNLLNTGVLWSDPTSATNLCESSGVGTGKGICWSWDASTFKAQFNFSDNVGTSNAHTTRFAGDGTISHVLPPGVWNDYTVTFDNVSGAYAISLNGVDVTGSTFVLSQINNVLVNITNAGGLGIGNSQNSVAGSNGFLWMSRVYIDTQNSYACTGAGAPFADCPGANKWSPSKLKLFHDGIKPVSLGTTGSKPSGSSPLVFNTGDGANFITNQGSGGAFSASTISNTVSPGSTLVFAAPYGPSGIPAHQATMAWPAQVQNSAGTGSASTSMAASLNTMPAAVGDFLAITYQVGFTSGAHDMTAGFACPTGGANTWTKVGAIYDSVESYNAFLCTTIAQTGDTTGPWTATFTAPGTAPRDSGWMVLDYKNVASLDQSGCQANASSTNIATKSGLSTTSANETVISISHQWVARGKTLNPPGSGVLRYREPNWSAGNFARMAVVDEYAVASGSNPQRTFTQGTADTSVGCTLTLVPN